MANELRLRPYIPAPLGLERSVSASGGSGWSGTNSYALVAWYKATEFSSMDAGIMALTFDSDPVIHSSDNHATGANDTVTFTWQPPPGREDVHHFSLYRQTASAYDEDTIGTKILPASGLLKGEIPGYATSCIITSPTARTFDLQLPVVRYVSSDRVAVAGDYTALKSNGLTITGSTHNNGAYSTDEAELQVAVGTDAQYGLMTTFQLASGSFNTSVHDGYVNIQAGKISRNSFYGEFALVKLYKVESCRITTEQFSDLSYSGNSLLTARAQEGNTGELRVVVPVTGIGMQVAVASSESSDASPWHAYRLLTHWLNEETLLEIVDINSDNNSPGQTLKYLYGRIKSLPDLGDSKGNELSVEIVFSIDRTMSRTQADEHGYQIKAVTTGANGTFRIDNVDLTWLLSEGSAFEVEGSTGNDGLYVVDSIAYATFNTTITVKRSVADGTADGRIRVYVPR